MEDVSNKQLQLTKWYLDNENKLYKFFLRLLILLNFIFWGLTIYRFTNYLLTSEENERMLVELTKERIDYLKFHEHFKPYDLTVVKSVFLASDVLEQAKKYDFLAVVENPNENLMVSAVEYYFFWETGQTETKETFILPGEKKYLTILGQETDKKLTGAKFAFSNIKWRRINSRKQPPEILSKLSVEEIKLDYVIAKDQRIAVPKVSFKIKNQSIYSFWQANFTIILYRGSDIVGLNVLSAKQWKSNEQREMELLWSNIPLHTKIAVILEINPFDSENFMSVY